MSLQKVILSLFGVVVFMSFGWIAVLAGMNHDNWIVTCIGLAFIFGCMYCFSIVARYLVFTAGAVSNGHDEGEAQAEAANSKSSDGIDDAIAEILFLTKERDKAAELMNRYGEDISLSDLFDQICRDKKDALNKLKHAKRQDN